MDESITSPSGIDRRECDRDVAVFTEARLLIDAEGRSYSTDGALSGRRWMPHRSATLLVARARRVNGSLGGGQLVEGEVAMLPDYVGLSGVIREWGALARRIRTTVARSSIIFVKQPGVIGALATFYAVRARVPVICEVVGDVEDVLSSGVAGWIGRLAAPLAGAITRRVVARARIVRYVTFQTLQHKYPPHPTAADFALSDVEVFEGGVVDREEVVPGRIVAVGSQEQDYKGHDLLIGAVALLRERLPHVSLELIGTGRRQESLRALAVKLGVGDKVTFSGQISDRAQLRAHLERSAVFAMPSRTEGMPRALIEAMSLGMPAIGSAVGGIPELLPRRALVRPGDLHDLARRLEEVLTDGTFARGLAANSIETAQKFAPARTRQVEIALERAVESIQTRTTRTVLHVLGSLDRGGAESVALDLVSAIPESVVQQAFFCFSGRAGQLATLFEQRGARVIVGSGGSTPSRLVDFYRNLRLLRPDIVVSHVSLASGVVLLVAASAGVRMRIARFHSQDDGQGNGVLRRGYRVISSLIIRAVATRSIGVTRAALEFGVGRKGAERANAMVLGNGVDTARFSGSRPSASEWLRVLYVGRAAPEKNRRALVGIFEETRQHTPTTWAVAGPGGVDDLGPIPSSDFRLLGDRDDIPELMSQADVLILPSIWEGLPGVVLEALSCGLPVVATDLASLRELASSVAGLFLVDAAAPAQVWALTLRNAAHYGRQSSSEIRSSILESEYALDGNAHQWRSIFCGD